LGSLSNIIFRDIKVNNLANEIYARNYGVLTHEEQQKLTNAKVTVIGAGGVGGIALISLARMGVGNIQVVDMDTFDYSNINRQMLSGISRLDKNKAECAKDTLLDINPTINVTISKEKLVEANAEEILTGSDVVIDATDNLISRVIIHRTAQKLKVPSVWIAVSPPFRGGVITFSHETPPYELVLRHPSYGKELTPEVVKQVSAIKDERARVSVQHGALADWADAYLNNAAPWAVLCPVANIVGICASFEALKVIINRADLQPTYAPNLVKIDLSQANMVQIQSPADGSWNNADL
jgi:molybdopterin/thiamine biosynthesis adenylyltransferase